MNFRWFTCFCCTRWVWNHTIALCGPQSHTHTHTHRLIASAFSIDWWKSILMLRFNGVTIVSASRLTPFPYMGVHSHPKKETHEEFWLQTSNIGWHTFIWSFIRLLSGISNLIPSYSMQLHDSIIHIHYIFPLHVDSSILMINRTFINQYLDQYTCRTESWNCILWFTVCHSW